MKKLYFITMHYINNFGSVLQTYATQLFFENLGYKTEAINYIRPNCRDILTFKYLLNVYKNRGGLSHHFPFYFLFSLRYFLISKRKNAIFNSFRKKYIHLSIPVDDESICNCFQDGYVYVVGSDQTWNTIYNGGLIPPYYLSFAPSQAIKVSFSSSIGMNKIPKIEEKKLVDYLSCFQLLTVREKSAVDMLSCLGLRNVHEVLDPTLVIDMKKWIEVLGLKHKKKKYVLIYQLNNNDNMIDFAVNLAAIHKIKVFSINKVKHKKSKVKVLFGVTPKDFAELIMNASYVVTDSFHGTAFSVNFHKEVFIFNPPKFYSRLQSIVETLSLQSHYIKDYNPEIIDNISSNPIDYKNIDKVLKEKRKLVEQLFASIGK